MIDASGFFFLAFFLSSFLSTNAVRNGEHVRVLLCMLGSRSRYDQNFGRRINIHSVQNTYLGRILSMAAVN